MAGCGGCGDDTGTGPVDSGPADAGPADGTIDARPLCDEFHPEGCSTTFPMEPVPHERLCSLFADIFCRANQECCTRPEEKYFSLIACTNDQIMRCMDLKHGYLFPEAIRSGWILYNQATTGAAAARIAPVAADCVPVRFERYVLMSMTGTLGGGQRCVPLACRDGLDCLSSGAPPDAGPDDAGVDPDAGAPVDGGPPVFGICQMEPAAGSACGAPERCGRTDLWCLDGACTERVPAGAPCSTDDICETSKCTAGTCDDFTADNAYCVRLDREGPAFTR